MATTGAPGVNFNPDPSDSTSTDITIWCTSQSQASGLLAAHAAARTAQREALRTKVAAARSPRASSQVQGGSAATPPTMRSAGSVPLASAAQRGSINVSPPQHRAAQGSPGDAHSLAGSRASEVSTLPPPPGEPGVPPPVVTAGEDSSDWSSPTGIADDASSPAGGNRTSTAFDGVSAGGSGAGAGWDVASVTSYGTSVSAQLQQDSRDSRSMAGTSTPVRRPTGFRRLVPGQHSGGTHTPEAANAEHAKLRLQVDELPRLPPFNEEFAATRASGAATQSDSERAQEVVQGDLPAAVEDSAEDSAATAKAIKNARHRYNVYTEIYETEKAYVSSLQSVVEGELACVVELQLLPFACAVLYMLHLQM